MMDARSYLGFSSSSKVAKSELLSAKKKMELPNIIESNISQSDMTSRYCFCVGAASLRKRAFNLAHASFILCIGQNRAKVQLKGKIGNSHHPLIQNATSVPRDLVQNVLISYYLMRTWPYQLLKDCT